jgi:hypothetical protein
MSIKSKYETVTLSDGATVTVTRMKWKDARTFLRLLAEQAAFSQITSLADLFASLPRLLEASEALATHLLQASTSYSPEAFDLMDSLDVLDILSAALRITLSPEVKKSCVGIKETVSGAIPTQDTGPGNQTTPAKEPRPMPMPIGSATTGDGPKPMSSSPKQVSHRTGATPPPSTT